MQKSEVIEYVCDHLCKYVEAANSTYNTAEGKQAALDEYCSHCKLAKEAK